MTEIPGGGLHRTGAGPALVLVHGLGASRACWEPVLPLLSAHREVVTFDLPGFGTAPPLPGAVTITAFADAVEGRLRTAGLLDADLVGSSMGAEIVLELLRRGHGGDVVALAPSGYWNRVGLAWFRLVAWTATVLVTVLRPIAPAILSTRVGREVFLRPLSPRPRRLPPVVVTTCHRFARTPSFVPALRHLGSRRRGVQVPEGRTAGRRVTLAWGRHDGLCLPGQAARALAAVPGATVHWFRASGHLSVWDEPEATARLLLELTGRARPDPARHG